MTCNACGRPVNTPRPYNCPEPHFPPAHQPTTTDYSGAIGSILQAIADLKHHVTEGNHRIMTDISKLQADHAALTALVEQIGPVVRANTDIVGRAVGAIEQLLAQIGSTGPTQAEIDALHASATAALTGLQADLAEVNASNATLQTEIGKVTPPPAPVT